MQISKPRFSVVVGISPECIFLIEVRRQFSSKLSTNTYS